MQTSSFFVREWVEFIPLNDMRDEFDANHEQQWDLRGVKLLYIDVYYDIFIFKVTKILTLKLSSNVFAVILDLWLALLIG